MASEESARIDAAIDAAARAMTAMPPPERLRRAVRQSVTTSAQSAPGPRAWPLVAVAAAVVVVAVVTASLVLRRAPANGPVARVATETPVTARPGGITASTVDAAARARPERIERSARRARPVARQTIVRTAETAGVVDIRPVAIAPLAGQGLTVEEMTPTVQIEIVPIDVELVRISELGELVE